MSEIFELYITSHFSAAHSLTGYSGDCSRTHGHNWIVEVHVKCDTLNHIGIGVDFRDIKIHVKEIVKELDHENLNDLPMFKTNNPTSELIAKYIYHEISKRLNSDHIRVSKVKVSETLETGAIYYIEER
ncbi:MAG: 6-carboxytetrahydropterin synthase QueD [Desulfobacterales bacterium]|nr:6-carboxytetrahydropterin synthase QueD [Desulfobacterales bacterium]